MNLAAGPAKDFFVTKEYVLIIGLAVMSCWFFGVPEVALCLFALIIAFLALTRKSMAGILPILCQVTFCFNDVGFLVRPEVLWSLVGLIVFVLAFSVVFLIKNRCKLSFTPPSAGFLFLLVASLLGGITTGYAGSLLWLAGVGAVFALFAAFLLLSNTVREYDGDFVSFIFCVNCVVLIFEAAVFYLRSSDVIADLTYKTMHVGWGVGNNVAAGLVTFLPFCLYRAAKSKFPYGYIALFLASCVAVLFTFSRGCCIIIALCALPLSVATVRFAARPKGIALTFAASILALSAVYYLLSDKLAPVFEVFLSRGIGDNGRIRLWQNGLRDWLSHSVLFGAGFGYGSTLDPYGTFFNWYHDTPLQFLSNFGLLGLAAYAFHFSQRIYYLARRPSAFTLTALAAILMVGSYGLIDVTYFLPSFLMPMLVILLAGYNHYRASPLPGLD